MRFVEALAFFLLILFLPRPELVAQQTGTVPVTALYDKYDKLYGLDQSLVNGVRYVPEYPGAEGHPFLDPEPFLNGSIRIGGKVYHDLSLAFDIYNRNLIMRYTNFSGAPEQVILPEMNVPEFRLGTRYFVRLDLDGEGAEYYQALGEGALRCYYLWSKSLNRSSTPGGSFYVFTEKKRKFFLSKNGAANAFKSKGSFAGLFPPEHQKAIKAYLRERKIFLNKISDNQMENLLDFCDGLEP